MDDVIINKAANLERCLQRIQEKYAGSENEFETNYTKQDAIILNLLRACETAIDMGTYAVRIRALGLPQSSREVFLLLENAKIVSSDLAKKMQAMVGFRNIAVHNYTKLDATILKSILKNELSGLAEFSRIMVKTF